METQAQPSAQTPQQTVPVMQPVQPAAPMQQAQVVQSAPVVQPVETTGEILQ